MNDKDKILAKAIARLQVGGRSQFSECFDIFLDAMLNPFCNNPGTRSVKICRALLDSESLQQAFHDSADAFGAASEGYHDALGVVFTELITKGEHGQFFTPDHLCSMLSRIVAPPDNPTLYDPACGSGRMALAALRTAREGGTVEPVFDLNDISDTCARMALLNLLVNTATGRVTVGDALAGQPTTIYYIDRLIGFNDQGGSLIISTFWHYTADTLESVNARRREWLRQCRKDGLFLFNQPRGGGIKEAEEKDYADNATPAVGEYNQLTLTLS